MIIEVIGDPVPQGSTRAFAIRKGKKIVGVGTTNDPQGTLAKWRGDIRDIATRTMTADKVQKTSAPVRMRIIFTYHRPKSHVLTDGVSLRKGAPRYPTHDIDKLTRAVLDALTGHVYIDDSQVRTLFVLKAYADPGQPGRAWISIEEDD